MALSIMLRSFSPRGAGAAWTSRPKGARRPLERLAALGVLVMLLLGAGLAAAQDADGDGVPDARDNCLWHANPDQHDDDQDLYGDVCDPDLNNDGIADAADIAEFKRLMGTGDLEPDLNGDRQVDFRDLGLLNDRLGEAPGPRGATAAEVDPMTIAVNPQLHPITEEVAGPKGFPPREVARLEMDGRRGGRLDLLLDEVVLITERPTEAEDLAARWSGVVMSAYDPARALGVPGPAIYRIAVDPSGIDTGSVADDLMSLDGRFHGSVEVSHDRALELIALAAQERAANGLDVSLNSLMGKTAIPDRRTTEAAATMGGASQPGGAPYTRDAFEWKSHEVDPDLPGDGLFPVDTGAAEAWRILDAAGLLANRSRAMVWDGGFWPNADFPPFTAIGSLRTPNTDPTGCGTGSPAPFGSVCEAHGTAVVEAGWGLPDNDFGTAGPGGPVTDLTLLTSPAIDVFEIIRFILSSVPSALATRPDVVNISAGFDIPAGWCLLACPPLDFLTRSLTDAGILIVAAAGNQSRDIDEEDQICLIFDCIRFESSTYAPCELDDVLCVGATEYHESRLASYSNWGTRNDANSVDLFAPGDLWSVDARSADAALPSPTDDLQIINGTSFATPFVAGVGTLVHSARPSLNGRQIRDCLEDTAHGPGLDSRARRRIDAVDAVRCATGGRSHPFIEITGPIDGRSYQETLEAVYVNAEADDREDGTALTIQWSSSIDGTLLTTTPGVGASLGSATLSRGTHVLTARVTDSSGLSMSDSVTVTITNPLPILEILSPTGPPAPEFYAGQTISLFGRSRDPNETPAFGSLDDAQVRWRVNGSLIGTGHSRSYPASALSIGFHTFCFEGTDDDGEDGVPDCQSVRIVPVPVNQDPVVTIASPTNGTVYAYPNGPVTVELDWTAVDPEDGNIPFGQTRVLTSTEGGPYVDRTSDVSTQVVCTSPQPPPIYCSGFDTLYFLDIQAAPGQASTEIRIRIEAEDSTPAPDTGTGADSVLVEIIELI